MLQNGFVVAEGKSKAKGKERRVFLFEKYLVICEPVEREAGLPAFKYIHSLKVSSRRTVRTTFTSALELIIKTK